MPGLTLDSDGVPDRAHTQGFYSLCILVLCILLSTCSLHATTQYSASIPTEQGLHSPHSI